MPRLVAFLRAVNVGGTGKLSMADLRDIAESLGLRNARTHLASGNLVFDTHLDPDDAALRLDTALGARMGKCPGVVIRNEAGLSALLDGLPFAEAPGSLVGILFLDRAATAADISEPRNRTTEEIAVHAGHIVVHYPDGMGRSHLGLDVTATGTMRNRNTVAAVAEMLRCLSRVSGVSDTAP
jgi:uncharacterized protein (DUF1697 family)